MLELLAPTISVAANGLLIWSGFRAWRFKKGILKWSGMGVAALLSIVVMAITQCAGGSAEDFRHARPNSARRGNLERLL
jgi:hypothetical protein